jgi:hypothetical protein
MLYDDISGLSLSALEPPFFQRRAEQLVLVLHQTQLGDHRQARGTHIYVRLPHSEIFMSWDL